ncbi:P-loop containing nucleoside triphosphate hydrolase protein [Irpex lacteus]|nr:P-loop containing nucleoside triphosphate hydrolase protein [Irpex lacteus]
MKHYRLACLDFIAILRPFFLENSVRRTLKSRDNRGHPIWEIRDPLDVVMHLEPTKMEKEVTSEMAKNASEARDTGAKFKHTFYLDARNSTLHVCFTDHILRDFHIPMRLEQYRDLPSTKIDTMIHIISWHRKQPGLPPLRVENANCRNYFVIDLRPPPDKVIIYSAFPVHNKYLCKILGFFDVHPFEIDGTKTLRERAEELARFRESPNFEVLFVSSVGTTGLNLECANILIILDVLWSKQDDTQLIGRLQRRGQTKLVIVYRLLIKDSPDVFLNDISFNKSIMHDTFMANETGWSTWNKSTLSCSELILNLFRRKNAHGEHTSG